MCVHMASDESTTVLSSMQEEEEEEEDEEEDAVDVIDRVMANYMSRLSIESFDADSDDEQEFSDSNKGGKHDCYYSLPATPRPRRRSRGRVVKDYASESEAQKSPIREKRRRIVREEGEDTKSVSGERDHAGGGGGGGGGGNGGVVAVVVMTRPKGGSRSLCMDMEEVKACRDLGFELEHERMLEMPLSLSSPAAASTLETTTSSSGGTSPMAKWRISSPG